MFLRKWCTQLFFFKCDKLSKNLPLFYIFTHTSFKLQHCYAFHSFHNCIIRYQLFLYLMTLLEKFGKFLTFPKIFRYENRPMLICFLSSIKLANVSEPQTSPRLLCRLSAVVRPLSHRSKHKRTRVMVVAAWLLAPLCSLPQVEADNVNFTIWM